MCVFGQIMQCLKSNEGAVMLLSYRVGRSLAGRVAARVIEQWQKERLS